MLEETTNEAGRITSVVWVIERHRRAFAVLERHLELTGEFDEESEIWNSEQLEISILEGEVEDVAIGMTNVSLHSIGQVV